MSVAEDLIMKARCRLLVLEPWYGTMASLMDWVPRDDVKTLGVRMKNGGRVECMWSPRFIEAIGDVEPLMACIQHEIEHVVRLHICRRGARDPQMSNIATDMCVNGPESNPRIDKLPMIPVFDEDGKKIKEAPPFWFPEGERDLAQDATAEEVYTWLDKKSSKEFVDCACASDLHSSSKKQQNKSKRVEGTTIDDHTVWDKSEVSEDEARQIVKDMVDQATKKAGAAPGHLKEAIAQLQEPKVNWKYVLKQWCGRCLGGKRRTYSRRNRRFDWFGIPGRSNHATVPLLVGVDVSGSVASNMKMLEQFFTEIEQMSHQFKITLVLWDAKIQLPAQRYHRGDWRKIPAKGGAGTNVVYFFEYLKKERLLHNVIICITDGEVSGWPEPIRETPVLWALPNDIKPPWGQVVKIEM